MIRRALPLALALLALAAPAFAQSVNTGPGCSAGITCSTSTVTGQAANSFELNNVSASSTVATLIPDKADPTSGVTNGGGTGSVGIAVGGTRISQWVAGGALEYLDVIGNSASGFRLLGGNASATFPTFAPRRDDLKAGVGGDAAGDVSIIVDKATVATEALRVTPTGVFNFSTIPVVTGTGTPTIATGSSDTAGEVTSGTSATSVIITFSATKTNAPFCTVTPQTQLAAFAYTISTTAITITQTATTGEKIDYHCFQH